MISLHESMGSDRDRTREPWICSQTRHSTDFAMGPVIGLLVTFKQEGCDYSDLLTYSHLVRRLFNFVLDLLGCEK